MAVCCVAILSISGPRPALAQQLELAFNEGAITLAARDVSVRQILDEWARLGGMVVVNADLVSDELVSLQFDGVPERQAIDIVLRSTSGYVATQRATDNPGPSIYGRMLVLGESASPAATAAAVLNPTPSPPSLTRPPPIISPTTLPLTLPSIDSDASAPVDTTSPASGPQPFNANVMPPSSPFSRAGAPPNGRLPGASAGTGTAIPGIISAPPPPDPDDAPESDGREPTRR